MSSNEEIDWTPLLHKIGAMVKARAIRKCPVDTGNLRANIDYEVGEDGTSVIITADAPYADYVEYGTGLFHIDEEGKADPHSAWPSNWGGMIKGMKPKPFMRPALYESLPEIESMIGDYLQ